MTGNQVGTATFDVYRDWTLSGGTFTGGNPQEFTVPARAAQDPATTFSTTGTVTVDASQAVGTFALAVAAFDITNTNTTGAKLAVGSSASYSVTVTAPVTPSDTTPPEITPVVSPATPDGDHGWYTSDVTLSWTVTDAESAITSQNGCAAVTITADQAATGYTCTATSAGGTSTQTVTIKRDATAPEITWVGGPSAGASYYFGEVPADPTCDATDNLSGVTATGCVVTGYSAAVGTHTLTASAEDQAGNPASEERVYTVLAWTLKGFYQPVDMSGTLNTVKGGSTVPLKFEVFAGDTELTDVSVVSSFKVGAVPCASLEGVVTDDIEQYTSGSTTLRYDTTGGQFIQNWQTPKNQSGTCYRVTLTTDDGSAISANFKLK